MGLKLVVSKCVKADWVCLRMGHRKEVRPKQVEGVVGQRKLHSESFIIITRHMISLEWRLKDAERWVKHVACTKITNFQHSQKWVFVPFQQKTTEHWDFIFPAFSTNIMMNAWDYVDEVTLTLGPERMQAIIICLVKMQKFCQGILFLQCKMTNLA
jgi:hypothetical protein